MGWLLGPFIGGVLGGFVVVRILQFIFGWVSSDVMNVVRPVFFTGTVTAVTTTSAMSRFTSKVRRLQRGSAAVSERIDSLTNTKRKRE